MAAADAHAGDAGWMHRRRRSLKSTIIGAVVLIAVLLVPSVIQPIIGDRWLPMTTVVVCAIYVLFALGLNIVVGYAGLLDLGYVAFFLFGAYSSAWLMSDFLGPVLDSDGNCASDRLRCFIYEQGGDNGIHIFFYPRILRAQVQHWNGHETGSP